MDVRKFRGAGVLMLCLLLTAAGIWNFRQGSLEVAGGISAGPVNEVDTAEAKVGLIFQVTGNGEETENVLKILRENGKKATFFVTESWGESWPELVTKIIQEGHELGLLSQEGKRWDRLSGREVRSLLEQAGEPVSYTHLPADSAAFSMLREELNTALESLTDRERQVVELRFGLRDGRARTLEEVGREFNVTRERIRQIEAKALRKLRHPSRSKRLKDFLI